MRQHKIKLYQIIINKKKLYTNFIKGESNRGGQERVTNREKTK